MIKVSIAIPVYNCEEYIEQCIRSVLNQTLKELEIICINDGSTDRSSTIIESLQREDARIYQLHQENQGAGAARNRAIQEASGKYIAFLDADDYYLDVKALDIMFHICETKRISACGSLRKRRRGEIEEPEILFQGAVADKKLAYQDFQLDYNYQSFLFLKDFLIVNNIFFPRYRRFQDPPFLVKVLYEAGSFYIADTYLYCYRALDMTPRFNPLKVRDLLNGLMDNLQFAQEHNLDILFRNTVQRLEDEYADIICKNLSMEDLSLMKLLLKINEIINIFYEKENYVIQPLRTLIFGLSQNLYRKELLREIEGQKEIALYGAGKYGKLFIHFLKSNHLQDKVRCFIVSDLNGNQSKIEGIPVIRLDKFLQEKKKTVYITVRGELQEEIRQVLEGYGYKDYVMVKIEFLHVIATEQQ